MLPALPIIFMYKVRVKVRVIKLDSKNKEILRVNPSLFLFPH